MFPRLTSCAAAGCRPGACCIVIEPRVARPSGGEVLQEDRTTLWISRAGPDADLALTGPDAADRGLEVAAVQHRAASRSSRGRWPGSPVRTRTVCDADWLPAPSPGTHCTTCWPPADRAAPISSRRGVASVTPFSIPGRLEIGHPRAGVGDAGGSAARHRPAESQDVRSRRPAARRPASCIPHRVGLHRPTYESGCVASR